MFNEQTIMSGDAQLFLRSAGGSPDSDVLLCVHGGPGLSHEYMAGLYDLASTDLRVVMYDQRGVGRSSGTVDGEILERQVEDLAAVRSALGADRVHLLGHSWGGLVVALASLAQPESISSAVFLDSVPATRPELDEAYTRLEGRMGELIASGTISLPSDQSDQTEMIRAVLPAYFYDPEHPRSRDHGGMTLDGDVYAVTLEALGHYDITRDIAGLSVPALVVAAPVPFATEMGLSVSESLPSSTTTTKVLAECGHIPWAEAPDRLFPIVSLFLGEV